MKDPELGLYHYPMKSAKVFSRSIEIYWSGKAFAGSHEKIYYTLSLL
jgi:hypothetical protein